PVYAPHVLWAFLAPTDRVPMIDVGARGKAAPYSSPRPVRPTLSSFLRSSQLLHTRESLLTNRHRAPPPSSRTCGFRSLCDVQTARSIRLWRFFSGSKKTSRLISESVSIAGTPARAGLRRL